MTWAEIDRVIEYDNQDVWEDPRDKVWHKNAGDALYELMEDLYCAYRIDKKKLHRNLLYLCKQLKVDVDFLQPNEDDLCVPQGDYTKEKLKGAAMTLKEELCGEEEINISRTNEALKQICQELGCPMYWGQRVTIVRENWKLIGKEQLMDYAVNLIKTRAGEP